MRLPLIEKTSAYIAITFALVLVGLVEVPRSSVAANASPSPAPTARPATSAEQATFAKFARTGWKMDMYAVAGNYALVGYYNAHGGMTGLLSDQNGTWTKIVISGGQLLPSDIVNYIPAISLSEATSLYNLGISQDK